jgi:hypothetical protein
VGNVSHYVRKFSLTVRIIDSSMRGTEGTEVSLKHDSKTDLAVASGQFAVFPAVGATSGDVVAVR